MIIIHTEIDIGNIYPMGLPNTKFHHENIPV